MGAVRQQVKAIGSLLRQAVPLSQLARGLAEAATALAGDRAWQGPDGRMAAELLAELQVSEAAARSHGRGRGSGGGPPAAARRTVGSAPFRRSPSHFHLGTSRGSSAARGPACAERPERRRLAGDARARPWLPPKVRATLGLPTLEYRIGLAAHDFASALGAPEVLITRARRDGRSPTVASRFLLRLGAISGGLPRDIVLERITAALDDPGPPRPVDRPEPSPPLEQRPDRISVTSVDRLKADPFAFYANSILRLRDSMPWMPTTRRGGRAKRSTRFRGVASPRRLQSRPSSVRGRSGCWRARRSIRCCARYGRRGCWKRSTGLRSWSARIRSRGAGR